jgi:hypothetical protein
MAEIPEFIYLQLDGDGGPEYVENCATWCDKQIFDTDAKYKLVPERGDITLDKS